MTGSGKGCSRDPANRRADDRWGVAADQCGGVVLAAGFDGCGDERARRVTDGEPAAGAEDEALVGLQLPGAEDVDQGLAFRTDASSQDVSVDGRARLGGSYLAGGHPRGDDRMIVGDLARLASHHDVGARVADVGDRDHAVRLGHERGDHRRRCRPLTSDLEDVAIR
jgi:hypothetical protein